MEKSRDIFLQSSRPPCACVNNKIKNISTVIGYYTIMQVFLNQQSCLIYTKNLLKNIKWLLAKTNLLLLINFFFTRNRLWASLVMNLIKNEAESKSQRKLISQTDFVSIYRLCRFQCFNFISSVFTYKIQQPCHRNNAKLNLNNSNHGSNSEEEM